MGQIVMGQRRQSTLSWHVVQGLDTGRAILNMEG